MSQGFRAGRAHPLVKVLPGAVDPLRLFAALTENGAAPAACLLESADLHGEHAVRSLGCAAPALRLSGRGLDWAIEALAPRGERFLAALRPALEDVDSAFGLETVYDGEAGPALLAGRLLVRAAELDEEERDRLAAPGPMDLLRLIQGAFPLERETAAGFPPGGLIGAFAYDFVECFETLAAPRAAAQADPLPVPDYSFVLADHLFAVDHAQDKTRIVATVFLREGEDLRASEDYHHAQEFMRRCEQAVAKAPALPALPTAPALEPTSVETDLDEAAYAALVERCQKHIRAGDVFQIVPSRSFSAPCAEPPLTVYRRLRALNPSPYMFFLRLGDLTLLGASPETALKVSRAAAGPATAGAAGAGAWDLSIRPIAGTRPRGLRAGAVDPDLDSRYESELKLDAKELAEHVMLVDLARNDVARVSEPGSRLAEALFVVEKYSHVQHLVSRVRGRLAAGLDPLHAYLATMNMGTLTGAPKVEAMRLLRRYEPTQRGFYGGAVGYYLLDGEFDTAIVIRSLLLGEGRAIARAGAGVVYDSLPAREAAETRHKARAPLAALGLAAGLPEPAPAPGGEPRKEAGR
jgi:anthranilate synthase component 1